MQFDNNIYRRPAAKVHGMSSRQQVLFLLQKTQKEANWNIENDSDFQDETYPTQTQGSQQVILKSNVEKSTSLTYNQEYDLKRQKLRQAEIKNHPERYRLMAYSLTQFIPIKKNKFLERKRHLLMDKEANALVCTCQKSTAKKNEKTNPHQSFNCGERCINRCVSTECCQGTCPSGPYCKNRRFQFHQNAYVYPAKTEKKGWGLFAGEFIPKGTFIMQYVGEVFSTDSDLGQLRVEKYKNSTCTYLMRTSNSEVIDPTFVGNIARFINHSCDPNCETQKWNVLGEVCVGIFSLRDIKENEELSFDYQFDFFKTPFTKCYCGSAKCKGFLGVLPTVADINSGDTSGSPVCSFCQKLIIEKEQLIVCSGFCKETFHISCIISKEVKNKASQQAFLQQLDKKNFFCTKCCQKLNTKRKRSKKQKIDDEFRIKEQEAAYFQAVISGENLPENPQEDKDVDVPPWESKDPSVRSLFENSLENRQLDGTILKEIEQIEEMVNDQKDQEFGKAPRSRRKNLQFCQHYLFMCEFQKRMKMRVKGSMKHFKFRKHKDQIRKTSSRRRRGQITTNEISEAQQVLVAQSSSNSTLKKKGGRPRTQPSLTLQNRNSQRSQTSEKRRSIKRRRKIGKDEESKGEIEENPISDIEEIEEDQEDEENENSQSFSDENEDQEEEEDEEDGEDANMDSDEDEDDDEDDENQDEEEDDEEDEEIIGRNDEDELNLDQLLRQEQGQDDDRDDEEMKESDTKQQRLKVKNPVGLDQLLTKDYSTLLRKQSQFNLEDSALKRNLRHLQAEDQDSSLRQKDLQGTDYKQTPLKHLTSPRKSSLFQSFVKTRIEDFVVEQNQRQFVTTELVFKESKFNLYETVFYFVIPEYIDELQCLPQKFQIYWEQSWGGMVTVRLISTEKQYIFLRNLFQDVADYLLKNGSLGGRHQSNQLILERQQSSQSSGSIPRIVVPFDIVMLQIPKNFLRQLVGYQEKKLNYYRKAYSVDFFYNKELLTDEVYSMNETTSMRIFGRTSEVYIVNEEIHKKIEQLLVKTMLLQMQDCKSVMDYVKEVKALIDPCEIRVKRSTKDKEWRDLKHPFFYCPNYFRELVLIGNEDEILEGEKKIENFLKQQRDARNIQQICYLLPAVFKNFQNDIRQMLMVRFPEVQFFFYDPTFPRKHITILLLGPWGIMIRAKQFLEEKSNELIARNQHGYSFQQFQQFTYHQQIRFSFKSLKRFVLEKDIKYLNHWDLCSFIVEQAGLDLEVVKKWQESIPIIDQKTQWQKLQYGMNPLQIAETIEREKRQDYDLLIKFLKENDQETCINSLFVLSDMKDLSILMRQFQVSPTEVILMMICVLRKNIEEFEETLRYQRYNYEQIKVIDEEKEGGGALIIQQSKDRRRVSRSRSRDIDIREELNQLNQRKRSKSRKRNYSSSSSSAYSHRSSREYKHYERRSRNKRYDESPEQQSRYPSSSYRFEGGHQRSSYRPMSYHGQSYNDSRRSERESVSRHRHYERQARERSPDSPPQKRRDFYREYSRYNQREPSREYRSHHGHRSRSRSQSETSYERRHRHSRNRRLASRSRDREEVKRSSTLELSRYKTEQIPSRSSNFDYTLQPQYHNLSNQTSNSFNLQQSHPNQRQHDPSLSYKYLEAPLKR